MATRGQSENWLAQKAKISQQTANNICRGNFGREENRSALLEIVGFDFLSFLRYGEKLYEKRVFNKEATDQTIQRPIIIQSAQELTERGLDTQAFIPIPFI